MITSAAGPNLDWLGDWKRRRDLEDRHYSERGTAGPRINVWHWLHKSPFSSCRCRDNDCELHAYYVACLPDENRPLPDGRRPKQLELPSMALSVTKKPTFPPGRIVRQ